MSDSANHHNGRANAGESQTVGGFLSAALNMEDQIGRGVYEEYMDRAHWPAELDEQVFSRIRERLTTLVEDTKKHHAILEALVEEHVKSE